MLNHLVIAVFICHWGCASEGKEHIVHLFFHWLNVSTHLDAIALILMSFWECGVPMENSALVDTSTIVCLNLYPTNLGQFLQFRSMKILRKYINPGNLSLNLLPFILRFFLMAAGSNRFHTLFSCIFSTTGKGQSSNCFHGNRGHGLQGNTARKPYEYFKKMDWNIHVNYGSYRTWTVRVSQNKIISCQPHKNELLL